MRPCGSCANGRATAGVAIRHRLHRRLPAGPRRQAGGEADPAQPAVQRRSSSRPRAARRRARRPAAPTARVQRLRHRHRHRARGHRPGAGPFGQVDSRIAEKLRRHRPRPADQPRRSPSCMAAASTSRARSARAPPSPSSCRPSASPPEAAPGFPTFPDRNRAWAALDRECAWPHSRLAAIDARGSGGLSKDRPANRRRRPTVGCASDAAFRIHHAHLDCYGTLIDWERGIAAELRPWAERNKLKLADGALLEAFGRAEAGPARPIRTGSIPIS